MKITTRRQEVLDFIKAYIKLYGVSPSYETAAKALKIKSKSNVHRIVHRLEEDGFLTIKPYKVHAIKVSDRSVREMSKL